MTTFSRLITTELSVAAPGNVTIAFVELGAWGGGGHSVTSVASRGVQFSAADYHQATITGGQDTYKESYVLPSSAAAAATGNATLALPAAGEWLVTFYCVFEVTPDPPTVGATAITSAPPWLEATIAGGDAGNLIEDFLVPWAVAD